MTVFPSHLNNALTSRVIAITNSEQGFGQHIALSLARFGARLILTGDNSEALASLASQIDQAGGSAIPMKANPSAAADWRNALERIEEIYGVLHGVVHVADRVSHSNFDYLPEVEWVELANYNVRSTIQIMQSLKRHDYHAWLTVIAPPSNTNLLHMHAYRGSIMHLTRNALSEDLRMNMLIPSRPAQTEQLDQGLSNAVAWLASEGMEHIAGNIIDIPLPEPDKATLEEEDLENIEVVTAEWDT